MKLNQYLLNQLAYTFFPIFLGLYFITTIIFLVKIASLTSAVTINVLELFQLYIYVVPSIIFYTMPISFFISLVITLSKLSSEYELIVISSLGLKPMKILKVFFPITLFVSIILSLISLDLMPKSKFLNKRFIEQKKLEANFNIKASEFGQKFGDWLIYIDKKEDKTYSDIKLFKTKDDKDQFILAKSAVLENDNGELSFKLDQGKSFYFFDEEFNQINYKSMKISDSIRENSELDFISSYDYWMSNLKKGDRVDTFTFYILTSLFPVLSLFLVITFGYFNPRYEKNRAIALSIFSIVIYYILSKSLTESILLHSLYLVPILWLIGTFYIYQKSVKQQY